MTKQIAFVLILALRIAYQPKDPHNLFPFTSPSPLPASTITSKTKIPVDENNTSWIDRVIRKWISAGNTAVYCFHSPVLFNRFYEMPGNPGTVSCILTDDRSADAKPFFVSTPLFNLKQEYHG